MRIVSAHGVAAGLWISLVLAVPMALAQDSTATATHPRGLADEYLAERGLADPALLRAFEASGGMSRDLNRPLVESVLYAAASTPGLNPTWPSEGQVSGSAELASQASTEPGRNVFLRGWVTITSVEVALLATTAALPKDWTGWHGDFVQDGLNNLGRAYSTPPTFDSDYWYHNYLGHPYGGSLYYNTIRSQGASKTESFLFSALLSTQWEYLFEAVAERPSIQDLIVTPVSGRIFGELINRMTLSMVKGGTSALEKIAITVLNPMYVLHRGY